MEVKIHDPEYAKFIAFTIEFRNLIAVEGNKQMKEFPYWDPQNDIRITSFWNLQSALDPLILLLIFDKGVLYDETFWQDNFSFDALSAIVKDPKAEMQASVDVFVKVGFFQVYFSIIESTVRSLLKEIDSSKIAATKGTFDPVLRALIKLLPNLPPETEALFEIARVLRNSIHNNGLYVPRENQTKSSLVFRQKRYDLKAGQALDWVHWNLVLSIAVDLYEFIKAVVKHPIVTSVQGLIEDPAQNSRQTAKSRP